MCGFSTSRQFLPGSCQRHERAFAAPLAKKRSGANAASAFPCAPPGSRGGAEGYSSAAVPGEGAAEALSRPVPQGELSPRSARDRSAGKGEPRRFTGEQPSRSQGASPRLRPHFCPPKSAELTWPLRTVLLSFRLFLWKMGGSTVLSLRYVNRTQTCHLSRLEFLRVDHDSTLKPAECR
ncbi:hypothetical protein DV515_00001810, partial [Chloebia gouldiae]